MTREEFKKCFAVFILSHGRAEDVKTAKMLKERHYTGDWYIVIDNEDNQAEIYYEKYGDRVIMFDKKAVAAETDTGDLDDDRRVGVFARNKIQDLAIERGYKYHLQFDDDFQGVKYRHFADGGVRSTEVRNLDNVFYSLVKYIDACPKITWLSFGLSSFYLGGAENNNWKRQMIPKTMGSFLMRADHPVKFSMRMNDDITTCALEQSRGNLAFTIMLYQVDTPATQHQAGGMTDIYQDNGTYRKSFYSVLVGPSWAKVSREILSHRIHHEIHFENCVPKLLSEKWKKESTIG